MVRHHPQWHAVRAHIRAGDIGTLRFMQVPFSYFNADAANIRNPAALGGGALCDIGCYAITAGRIEIEIPFNAPETEPCRSMIQRAGGFITGLIVPFGIEPGPFL